MTDTEKTCDGKTGFDYCFWAKLLIAIPLFPIIAVFIANLFDTPEQQSIAVVLAVIAVVLLSRWIDRIPALKKKIGSK